MKAQKSLDLQSRIKKAENFLKLQNIGNWDIQQRMDFAENLLSISIKDRKRIILDMEKVRDNPELYFNTKEKAEKISVDIQDFLVEIDHLKFKLAEKNKLGSEPKLKITKKELYNLNRIFKGIDSLEKLDKIREEIRDIKRKEESNPQVYKRDFRLFNEGKLGDKDISHRGKGTGHEDWYTPPEIIENARKVMGSIDLDPASSEDANNTVKATRFFSVKDSAYDYKWKAKTLYMNPPFSRGKMSKFIEKFIAEYGNRNINQAIVLTNNNTETKWGQSLLESCDVVFFPNYRIKFLYKEDVNSDKPAEINPDKGGQLQGQMILGFNVNQDKFKQHFHKGIVLLNKE